MKLVNGLYMNEIVHVDCRIIYENFANPSVVYPDPDPTSFENSVSDIHQ